MRQFVSLILLLAFSEGRALAQPTTPQAVKLSVTGMHCSNCAQNVDKALRAIDGVKDVRVDLKSKTAEVTFTSTPIKPELLVKAVSDAGYSAELATTTPAETREEKCACCSGKEGHKHKEGASMRDDCCKNKKKANSKS
jgi:copper chaperone CopZ